jgi:hypothetical protein
MKKVIFEGVVNGKKFDNIQDYNDEMKRLINQGATDIQASSNTRVVSEPEEEKKEQELEEFDPNVFLPYFNSSAQAYYLDTLVSDDDKINEKNVASAEIELKNTFELLKQYVEQKKLTIEETIGFFNILKEIRSNIFADSEANRKAVVTVNEGISDLTNKLKLLNNAKPVMATVAEYYDRAFDLLRGYILNR